MVSVGAFIRGSGSCVGKASMKSRGIDSKHRFQSIGSCFMNLRQLRYFCEIVEAGSAVAAAARLHVAPTALSMQLGQLEEDLGGELFNR